MNNTTSDSTGVFNGQKPSKWLINVSLAGIVAILISIIWMNINVPEHCACESIANEADSDLKKMHLAYDHFAINGNIKHASRILKLITEYEAVSQSGISAYKEHSCSETFETYCLAKKEKLGQIISKVKSIK